MFRSKRYLCKNIKKVILEKTAKKENEKERNVKKKKHTKRDLNYIWSMSFLEGNIFSRFLPTLLEYDTRIIL